MEGWRMCLEGRLEAWSRCGGPCSPHAARMGCGVHDMPHLRMRTCLLLYPDVLPACSRAQALVHMPAQDVAMSCRAVHACEGAL